MSYSLEVTTKCTQLYLQVRHGVRLQQVGLRAHDVPQPGPGGGPATAPAAEHHRDQGQRGGVQGLQGGVPGRAQHFDWKGNN